jgi:hypothetical protein
MKLLRELNEAYKNPSMLEATDYISQIVNSTFDKEAVKREWGAKNGINSKKAIDAIERFANMHSLAAQELIQASDIKTVMAGEKVVSRADFLKLVQDLRKTLNDAMRRHDTDEEIGTRLIKTIVSQEELDAVKASTKEWNKQNKLNKVKLQVFNRPANKEYPNPYFKVYIDGANTALKQFR